MLVQIKAPSAVIGQTAQKFPMMKAYQEDQTAGNFSGIRKDTGDGCGVKNCGEEPAGSVVNKKVLTQVVKRLANGTT